MMDKAQPHKAKKNSPEEKSTERTSCQNSKVSNIPKQANGKIYLSTYRNITFGFLISSHFHKNATTFFPFFKGVIRTKFNKSLSMNYFMINNDKA